MIDFQNAKYLKLHAVDAGKFMHTIQPLLVQGEQVAASYQSIRDYLVFTNKRIIAVNVQGITGKKQDYTSLPYSKIQAFSVETAGVLDLDAELELWFSGLGRVKLEFAANADISGICRMIGSMVL
ncbi:MAG: PH domain-containing protein [Clostridia bacterium]|nr:PH domain-containing protein [Clostridia bacterium]